jgi:hypothetical protein
MRNLKRVKVSPQFWLEMMTEGWTVRHVTCTEGLPTGAKFVRDYTDNNGNVVFVFSHGSFEPVTPGHEIPEITPTFKAEYPVKESK